MAKTTSDVVVVGGGFAGLVAAARAAELGLAVTVLERGTGPNYPCNSRWSGGVLHVAYTDILSPPDALVAAMTKAACGAIDLPQARAFAENAGRLIAWLKTQGATFVGTKVDWQQHILEPMRALRAGLDWEARGPDVMMGRLAETVRRAGGRIVLDARARSLIPDGGRCRGVFADVAGRSETFPASAVILADGGFQANLDLLRQHIAPHPERIKQRGAANGAGDGLVMALEAGAAVGGLDRFYGHLLSRDAMTNDAVWPYPELDALATAGVLVGRDGRRFADEGQGGIALTNILARSDDPLGATIILDQTIWEGPGRSARIPANPTLEAAGGTVLRADRLAALAQLAAVPVDALERTVARHNEAIASGQLSALHPSRSSDRHRPMPIAAPPFLAIPVCAGITYTMGGIQVDGHSRVQRPDGETIAGLYAAGSNTGGLEGGGGAGADGRSSTVAYLGGLAKAGVQGLIAAENIAHAQRTTSES